MLLNMPWDENLGGPKPQIELAREFRKRGHEVEKFDLFDAFPEMQVGTSRIRELIRSSFPRRAKAFVRANAHRFDIIDCQHGNLPFSKNELGFDGLLVARSAGLYALYREFAVFADRKWPSRQKAHPIVELLTTFRQKREASNCPISLITCDLINVANEDERAYLAKDGLADKCVVIPLGLTRQQQDEFRNASRPATERLSSQKIVFIGAWSPRKGSQDWGDIVRAVKARVPEARFLFLGTGFSEGTVLSDLGVADQDWIEIVPHYNHEHLPLLLSTATVGAFPSYVEGFGIGVLEKLAAGIPTVAYDAPGPREMLRQMDGRRLIPVGDTQLFSSELVNLLTLDRATYDRLSDQCRSVAKNFTWREIADKTLSVYSSSLAALGRKQVS